MARSGARPAAAVVATAATGVAVALALVGVGIFRVGHTFSGSPAALVQVAGKLLPVGGPSLWDAAIKGEPQRLMKKHQVQRHACVTVRAAPAAPALRTSSSALRERSAQRPWRILQQRLKGGEHGGQVDFHRLPAGHCPEDTPGCAVSHQEYILKSQYIVASYCACTQALTVRISLHQADHHIVLASDRHPRNYVYNYFTDEGDAVKDVTQVSPKRVSPARGCLSLSGDLMRRRRCVKRLGPQAVDFNTTFAAVYVCICVLIYTSMQTGGL